MKKVYFFGLAIACLSIVSCSTSEETVSSGTSQSDPMQAHKKDSIKKKDVRGTELATPQKQSMKPLQEEKEVL